MLRGLVKATLSLLLRARWRLVSRTAPPADVRRILVPCFYPLGIGDALMDTPALRALRERFPHAEITLIADSDILLGNKHIDGIIRIPRSPFAYRKQVRTLRGRYDLVVLLNKNLFQSLFALAVRPRYIIGYVDSWTIKANFPLLAPAAYAPNDHFYEMALRVVRNLGADAPHRMDSVVYGPDASRRVRTLLGPRHGRRIILVPHVLWPSRTWPRERYLSLAQRLLARGDQVIITGGPDDVAYNEPFAERFAHHERFLDLTGKLSFPELAALFAQCDLGVMGDCGPMHIAIAEGLPLVTFWGPTDPKTRIPSKLLGTSVVALYHPEHPDAGTYAMETDPGGRAIEAISLEEALSAVAAIRSRRRRTR